MSSIVTRPAKPPYSSTTIAMWIRWACISRSSSSTGLDSGTNVGGRMTSSTFGPRLSLPFWERRTRSLR